MSYGGHISDMIRRDSENRELRRGMIQRLRDIRSESVLGKKINYKKVSLSKLEEIAKQNEEKERFDRTATTKKMIRIVSVGLVVAVFVFFFLNYAVNHWEFFDTCRKNFLRFFL